MNRRCGCVFKKPRLLAQKQTNNRATTLSSQDERQHQTLQQLPPKRHVYRSQSPPVAVVLMIGAKEEVRWHYYRGTTSTKGWVGQWSNRPRHIFSPRWFHNLNHMFIIVTMTTKSLTLNKKFSCKQSTMFPNLSQVLILTQPKRIVVVVFQPKT